MRILRGLLWLLAAVLLIATISYFASAQPARDAVAAAEQELGIPLESRRIAVGDVTLHVVLAGPEHGEPVLLLHGFPEFWYEWKNQLLEFGRDYQAVALDMRGYNLSSKPSDLEQYRMKYLAEDLRALAAHLGHQKFILVGHDWGGAVCWSFPLYYPDTLVGTDSHTTMVNGLGVLGWGVGGIEAEAAMLGQPISMLIPQVVGFRLTGTLPDGQAFSALVYRPIPAAVRAAGNGRHAERRDPGDRGTSARRISRVRQRAGSCIQHRHAARWQRVSRRRQLLLHERRHDRAEHHPGAGQREAVLPQGLHGYNLAALRTGYQGSPLVLRGRPPGDHQRHPPDAARPRRTDVTSVTCHVVDPCSSRAIFSSSASRTRSARLMSISAAQTRSISSFF